MPTLRVTNVTEDATEDDLRELFSKFGRVARVYIGKDRETGIGKGFAFVSFDDRAAAAKAIEKVDGKGEERIHVPQFYSAFCVGLMVRPFLQGTTISSSPSSGHVSRTPPPRPSHLIHIYFPLRRTS
jgi:RNA recognition motif-containing protein